MQAIERIATTVETSNITLQGLCAIEDKLQDGVSETIIKLSQAGIKIWMLTGDKVETAIAVGKQAGLIQTEPDRLTENGHSMQVDRAAVTEEMCANPESESSQIETTDAESSAKGKVTYGIRYLVGLTSLAEIFQRLEDIKEHVGNTRSHGDQNYAIIDGDSLAVALANEVVMSQLVEALLLCQSVICCRLAPLQKAALVKCVKDHNKPLTLAIGDGANDVPMIQESLKLQTHLVSSWREKDNL